MKGVAHSDEPTPPVVMELNQMSDYCFGLLTKHLFQPQKSSIFSKKKKNPQCTVQDQSYKKVNIEYVYQVDTNMTPSKLLSCSKFS